MALAQRTGRSRHRLILLALVAITLLTVDLRGFGPVDSAQRFVRDALNPVTSIASTVFSPVGDAWNSAFNYDDLEAENEALRVEVEELRGAAIRGDADSEALRRLLEATDLPYVGDLESVAAEVVRGPVGNFADHVVTINRGSDDGLTEGMAVVTSAGLVGRVDRVDNTTSTVQLLSDASLFVGVRMVDTGDVGLGHGVPGQPGMFLVDRGIEWPDTDDPALLPQPDTAVVTAGESRYPAELPVGMVIAVERASDDGGMAVEIALAADVSDLHFVSVILAVGAGEFPLQPVVPAGVDELLPELEADDGDPTIDGGTPTTTEAGG